ncbi:MAG: penicillin-binding protein 1C [Pseudomonadota bacterium]
MGWADIFAKVGQVARRLAVRARRGAVYALAFAGIVFALDWMFPPPIERGAVTGQWVSDRDGRPLRAFPAPEGRWRFTAELSETDPLFIEALLRIEDKRFHRHWGVDWTAMVRAAATSARAGRVVSGGSTITMQTARLLEPRRRTIGSKLIEMVRAHQIEARLSKQEILELYLTLAPYGGNLEGVRAASWAYFGHGPQRLTDDEIALLIALPQSPERRRPDRQSEGAAAGRASVAAKLEEFGLLSSARAREVEAAPLPGTRFGFPNLAWHASATVRRGASASDMRATLDAPLQAELETLLASRVAGMGNHVQVAALIVDRTSRCVRAAIGSVDRRRPGGWMDLTQQPRSPGSTLKPFIYAMAFDDGIAAPGTLISDLPRRFASYQPENFDRSFRGDVTVAQALQHSLNVPAVLALSEIGPNRFAATLSLAGAHPMVRAQAETSSGLALALGGAGLTVRDVARLYGALGDDGLAKPLCWTVEDERSEDTTWTPQRLMSSENAASVLSILADTPAPSGRVPGRLTREAPTLAFKTGTSYGFRDAWAAGVSEDHVVVVWVGRADGAPRPGVTGRAAALPLLFEIADRAAQHLGSLKDTAEPSGEEPYVRAEAALRRFSDAGAPQILFPPEDAELWAGPVNGRKARAFVMTARGDGQLAWYIDGQPAETDAGGLPIWMPDRAGYYEVAVFDDLGRSSAVGVRVIGLPAR